MSDLQCWKSVAYPIHFLSFNISRWIWEQFSLCKKEFWDIQKHRGHLAYALLTRWHYGTYEYPHRCIYLWAGLKKNQTNKKTERILKNSHKILELGIKKNRRKKWGQMPNINHLCMEGNTFKWEWIFFFVLFWFSWHCFYFIILKITLF